MAPIYLGKRVLPSSFRYIENLAYLSILQTNFSQPRNLLCECIRKVFIQLAVLLFFFLHFFALKSSLACYIMTTAASLTRDWCGDSPDSCRAANTFHTTITNTFNRNLALYQTK